MEINYYQNLEKKYLESSNLDWVAYDESEHTLYVCFKNGSIYAYFNVPEGIMKELFYAQSKGKYHNKNIKWKYKYKKVN